MYRAASLSIASILAASSSMAQGVEYLSYGASYANLSADGGSVDIFSLGGSIDYRVNNAFIGGTISYTDLSGDGDDFGVTGISARAGYFVVPQAVIYGGLNYVDTSETSSFSTYNIGAEYMIGAVTLGVNYDDSDESGYIESTSIYAGYQVGDALEIAAGFTDTDGDTFTQVGLEYDDGTYDVAAVFADLEGTTLFGVDASYDFGNRFRVLGGYLDFDGEADLFTMGGGYEVSNDMWVDLEFGRADLDGVDFDTIGVAFTYEMGRETLLIDRVERTQVEALGVLGSISEF